MDRPGDRSESPDGLDEAGEAAELVAIVSITLNPRWSREFTELRHLAERLRNVGLALGLFCASLGAELEGPDQNRWDRIGRRLLAYQGLARRVHRAVLSHEGWWELPGAEELFGALVDEQASVLALAEVAIERRDPATAAEGASLARESAARVLALGEVLVAQVVRPAQKESQVAVDRWQSAGPISIEVPLADEVDDASSEEG